MIDSDGGRLPVEICNISGGGFRLRAEETLVIGETVRLLVGRHGDLPAQILWVAGYEAGGRFLAPAMPL